VHEQATTKESDMATNVGQLARAWLAQEIWGIAPREDRDLAAVAKAVLICAQGDGQLTPAERDWVIGSYAARGVSAALLDELRAYEGKDDIAHVLAGTSVQHAAPRVVVYTAMQACAADGELHPREMAAIVKMGGLLGVSEDVVKQLKAVHDEEQAVRLKRIKLAFPDGPPR
jgi:tellurite resistance protein